MAVVEEAVDVEEVGDVGEAVDVEVVEEGVVVSTL